MSASTDGTGDAELLRAISANAECAHVLAAIAAGGNARELIATLLPSPAEDSLPEPTRTEDAAQQTDTPTKAEPEQEPAMYQSAAIPPATEPADTCPGFLAHVSTDFWDNF